MGRGPGLTMETLYEALGAQAGVLKLAHAWHERVLADEVVSHAFSHGFHPRHTERLAAYWAEAWGGPPDYSGKLGSESSVVRMHSGNGSHEEMDRRAIECFDRAMDDIGLTDERLRRALHDYFAWATATSMAAYPQGKAEVPTNLRIPRWSWGGLQSG
jgi:hemoglobin